MDRFHSLLDSVLHYPFARLVPIAGIATLILLVVHGVFAMSTPKNRELTSKRGMGAMFVYIAFGLVVSVLALTSFGAIILYGKMEHEALLIHIMAAGAFTAVMVVFAYVWNPVFGRPLSTSKDDVDHSTNGWWVARWSLWLVLLSSLGVAGSMLLGMLPLFSTEQMHVAVALHRYCGLLLVAGLIVHLYALAIQRFGWR
jgi:hypothetical protein